MQIDEYNGSAILAMAGEKCVAIGCDLRFGVQMQTMATDYQKVMQVRAFFRASVIRDVPVFAIRTSSCVESAASQHKQHPPFVMSLDRVKAHIYTC